MQDTAMQKLLQEIAAYVSDEFGPPDARGRRICEILTTEDFVRYTSLQFAGGEITLRIWRRKPDLPPPPDPILVATFAEDPDFRRSLAALLAPYGIRFQVPYRGSRAPTLA